MLNYLTVKLRPRPASSGLPFVMPRGSQSKSLKPARTLLVVIGAAALTGAAWLGWRTIGPTIGGVRASDLNVLVVSLDTTRADRIHAYGFQDIQTPVLDSLASEGVLFLQAATTAPLTLPAHTTIFTSRVPPAHGVRDNGGFFVDPAETTLAERLREAGFRTGAFVGAYVLDSKWGLDQGFDTYFDDFDLTKYRAISLGAIQRPANEVVDKALEWLNGVAGERFFGWVHLYDPHTPYEPPEPYRSQYAGRPYLGEIAFTDSQVGRLVDFLRGRGLLDRTVIVVVGDHGESLDDHGEASHGFFIYESVVRVPLIIRAPLPGARGRQVADVVRTLDIAPTIAELLELPRAAADEGVSLVPLMRGETPELGLETYSESMYPLYHYGWSDLRALRSGRFKLIAAPRPELYDLEQDPGERRNLFEERRQLGDRMLARLVELEAGFAKSERPKNEPDVDPEARARLAALGYIGSFIATAPPDASRSGLADPKDKIRVFNLISKARDISKDEKRFDEVVGMLKQVVGEDPNVIDAWFMLGNVHTRANRQEQAIEYFKRVLALKPDDEMATVNMANAYRQIGKDEEALVGYRRFLQLDPKNAQVRYEIAQILIDHGELNEAAAQLNEALRIDPKMAAARNALGVVALKSGNAAQAEREIRAAIAQRPDVRLAHFNLALIAEERRDHRTAIEEYLKEIEQHPSSYKAIFNLGRLYGEMGQREAQITAYREAIAANPMFAEGHLYLAKLLLDLDRDLPEAARLAARGVELRPRSPYAPLGHYVMADVYSRQGQPAKAAREAARGRRLERQLER
jgi:arylsulfatase A-like enzyme/Tfp pilus assembly protein PilF